MLTEKVKEAKELVNECAERLRSKSVACQDDIILIKWAIVKDMLIKLEKVSLMLEGIENVKR